MAPLPWLWGLTGEVDKTNQQIAYKKSLDEGGGTSFLNNQYKTEILYGIKFSITLNVLILV